MKYLPNYGFFWKLKVLFSNKHAVLVFRKDRPPIKGDTITVNELVAEFK